MDARWRNASLETSDLMQLIVANGKVLSPIWTIPWLTNQVFRIDWLHAADQGVAADWIGNVLKFLARRSPGANLKEKHRDQWTRVQAWYDKNDVHDRLNALTPSMIQAKGKPPKLRCSAAQCRALIPFVYEQTRGLSDVDVTEQAIKVGTLHLWRCYEALSSKSIFAQDILLENSVKFALQYVALSTCATAENPLDWKVKPKLHMFLEVCSDGSLPSMFWCYRDEDYGGSVARLARRRGGLLSAQSFSRTFLQRWRCSPMIRLA